MGILKYLCDGDICKQSQVLNIEAMEINSPASRIALALMLNSKAAPKGFLCYKQERIKNMLIKRNKRVLPLDFAIYGIKDRNVRASTLYN